MTNDQNEHNAGFAWRGRDRGSSKGSWLRDLALALAVALAAMALLRVADAHAGERIVRIGGNHCTAMVTVTIGKSQDVRTD